MTADFACSGIQAIDKIMIIDNNNNDNFMYSLGGRKHISIIIIDETQIFFLDFSILDSAYPKSNRLSIILI